MGHGGIGELFLERLEVAKGLFDRVGEFATGLAAAIGLHRGPVEAVIEVLGGVVEKAAGSGLLHDLLDRRVFVLGPLGEIVEIGDIGGVMLAVMELQRFPGKVRRESVNRIGQIGECESHESDLSGETRRR